MVLFFNEALLIKITANALSLCDGRMLPGFGFRIVPQFVDNLNDCFPRQARLIA
jgi:hypothetical protein